MTLRAGTAGITSAQGTNAFAELSSNDGGSYGTLTLDTTSLPGGPVGSATNRILFGGAQTGIDIATDGGAVWIGGLENPTGISIDSIDTFTGVSATDAGAVDVTSANSAAPWTPVRLNGVVDTRSTLGDGGPQTWSNPLVLTANVALRSARIGVPATDGAIQIDQDILDDADAAARSLTIDAGTTDGTITFGDGVDDGDGDTLGNLVDIDGTLSLTAAALPTRGIVATSAAGADAAAEPAGLLTLRIADLVLAGAFDLPAALGTARLELYTHDGATTMGLGDAGAGAWSLTDGELAFLDGSEIPNLVIGETGAQSGAVTFVTADLSTTTALASVTVNADAAGGSIVFTDSNDGAEVVALDVGGADLDLRAHTRIRSTHYRRPGLDAVADITTTGTITLDVSAAGPAPSGTIGDDPYGGTFDPLADPGALQITAASTTLVNIDDAPGGVWIEGIGGEIRIGSIAETVGPVSIDVFEPAGFIRLTDNITTNGQAITFRRPVRVDAEQLSTDPLWVSTTGDGSPGADIAFRSSLDSADAAYFGLTLDAGTGSIEFDGRIGLDAEGIVGGTGVGLFGPLTISAAADVTFADRVATGNGAGVDITYSGTLSLQDPDGIGDTATSDWRLDGAFFDNPASTGNVDLQADIVTSGETVTFNTPVTISGNVRFDTTDATAETAGGAVPAGGTIAFNDSLIADTDTRSLTINAGTTGNVAFDGAVGAGGAAALGAVSIGDGAAVTLAEPFDAASLTSSSATFAADEAITTSGVVSITTTAGMTFLEAGDITTTGGAAATVTLGAGGITTAGEITTSGADVSIQSAVTLTGNVAITTGGGAGDVGFDTTIDGGSALSVTTGTGGVTFDAPIGGATPLNELTVTGATATFNGIGGAAAGVSGNASVVATGRINLLGMTDYRTGGSQTWDAATGALLAPAADITLSAGGDFLLRDLYIDAPGRDVGVAPGQAVVLRNFVFYRGSLDIRGVSVATTAFGGGDFVAFGSAYNPDDPDRGVTDGADNALHAYPAAAALDYYPGVAPAGGTYNAGTGDFGIGAPGPQWARFATGGTDDLTGATITVGSGGTGDFYVNGVDLLGGGWTLAVQDTRDADPVANGPFGSPYAVFFNGDVENSTVTAGQISAASPAVSALDGAVTHRNNNVTADGAAVVPTAPGAFSLPYAAPTIPDTTNTDFGRDNPDAGWDFVAPYLVYAQTVRDDVIRLTFSEAIENSNDEINAAVAQIFTDAGGDAMAEALVDVSSTPNEVPYSFATTDGRGDLITFYIRTSGPAWATDATGTTPSVSGIGYDRTGARWNDSSKDGGAGVVPDLRMLKATLYDAASNTPIVNYGYNQDGGANPFPTFDETSDEAGAVLYEIRYGRAAHNEPVATPYDGHNYFHLYYSEPVSIGTNPVMSAATPTAENLRNEASLGSADNRGGDIRNAGGDILVEGFFQFSYNDPRVTGPMERGARDAGTEQNSAHSLYRDDTFGVDPFTPGENANELRIYLSGYNSDDAWGGPDANGGFLGWHANVPNPGTVTAVTVPANGAILDATDANAVDHQLSTAVIADSLDPEPDGSDVAGAGGSSRPGYSVGVADPEDTNVQFPGGTVALNDWDVIAPFFSSFSLDLGSADNTPETFEIVSLDSDLNGLIDTIEFHVLDNSDVLDYRNVVDDYAPDPQGLGIVLDESGNPYPDPPAVAGDNRPLWDPENISDAPDPDASLFTHRNLRPNEGIRDFSFFDLSNDPDPLTAFAIERVDTTPLRNDVVDGFSTSVDNIFFGTVLTADDGYFRIDLDETQHNWDLLTELYLTYDETVGRFTDLAGNLMPSTALPIRAIERTPPRIEISLGVAGDDRLYLKFSEPVFGDQDRTSDITFEDLVVPGNPPTGLDVVSRSTQPGSGSGGITEVFLRLTDPIEPDDAFSGRIRPVDSSAIFDKAQNAMPEIDERRLTDVALGVIEPIWATDSFGTNDAGDGDFRTIRSFDGTAELSSSDITVQSRLLTSVYSGLPVSLLFDLNVSDEDRVPDLIDPSTIGRFWSPDPIPGIVSRGQISPARSVLAYEVDGVLRNFIIPRNDSEMRQGGPMELLFRVGPLTAANLTDPTDPRTLAPWLLNIGDGFIVQRSNVTILNNVIYPERGESTVLVYDIDRPGMVTVTVFGLDGSVIRSLHRGRQGTGSYRFGWDGRNNTGQIVARGIYFVRVVAPGVDEYRKVIVAKD